MLGIIFGIAAEQDGIQHNDVKSFTPGNVVFYRVVVIGKVPESEPCLGELLLFGDAPMTRGAKQWSSYSYFQMFIFALLLLYMT